MTEQRIKIGMVTGQLKKTVDLLTTMLTVFPMLRDAIHRVGPEDFNLDTNVLEFTEVASINILASSHALDPTHAMNNFSRSILSNLVNNEIIDFKEAKEIHASLNGGTDLPYVEPGVMDNTYSCRPFPLVSLALQSLNVKNVNDGFKGIRHLMHAFTSQAYTPIPSHERLYRASSSNRHRDTMIPVAVLAPVMMKEGLLNKLDKEIRDDHVFMESVRIISMFSAHGFKGYVDINGLTGIIENNQHKDLPLSLLSSLVMEEEGVFSERLPYRNFDEGLYTELLNMSAWDVEPETVMFE